MSNYLLTKGKEETRTQIPKKKRKKRKKERWKRKTIIIKRKRRPKEIILEEAVGRETQKGKGETENEK